MHSTGENRKLKPQKKAATHLNQNVVPHKTSVVIHEIERQQVELSVEGSTGKSYKATTGLVEDKDDLITLSAG